MKLLSINIGTEGYVQRKNYRERTGIFKKPLSGAVQISKLGIAGDLIVSEKYHGGVDQALYIYGQADYDWWRDAHGLELGAGTFGENLTISNLRSAEFNIGDRIIIGEVILQVTAPRIPCKTFAARMEDPQFVKKFRDAERPGLYCRVLQEGSLQAGDSVRVEKYAKETVSLLDIYRDHYAPDLRPEAIQRFLDVPIAIRNRIEKEEQLEKIMDSPSKDSPVSLREVTRETLRTILNLSVAENQRQFVATNATSIAQAHFYPEAWFRAIYADETPVGFLMLEDKPMEGAYFLWRLMVDARYQGYGFGRRAIELLIEHVKTRPEATKLTTSCVLGEGSPLEFYKKLGFSETGEMIEDEMVLELLF